MNFSINFLINIAIILSISLTVKADVLVCDNNECRRAAVLTTDSLFRELETIVESNRNTTRLLAELNHNIEHKISNLTTEIDDIKKLLFKQTTKLIKHVNELKNVTGVDKYSLYNNLWIVIQRRQDGSVDFYRNWTEYRNGFGNPLGEFFVGLEKIYELTNNQEHELLVILEGFDGYRKYAHYDQFLIGNETERYRLKKLGKYSGSAGDYLRLHLNMFFSTMDRDNDEADEGNCAKWFKGAWWYYHCMTSNLNGPYRNCSKLEDKDRGVGITWGSYDEIQFSYKFAQMMLRSKKPKEKN